jgi:hypothetical protein
LCWASRGQLPPPTKIRKIKEQNIEKSVRASLTIYQNPWLGRNNSGILVVAIAVEITITNGIAAAPRPKTEQHQGATGDFKRANEVRGEVRVLKSYLRETKHAHGAEL